VPEPPLTVGRRARWRSAPLRLARLHAGQAVGSSLRVTVTGAPVPNAEIDDLLVGAGYADVTVRVRAGSVAVRATRARTLPDFVAPGLRVLVCGLNPSLHAADAGVGFAGPGNRFWPAAVAAGLVDRPGDPLAAARVHGMGMTDLVKRATPAAAALRASEYREGAARVERLVQRIRPDTVCFVGLAGYRAAVDPHAVAGEQARGFGGARAYVMPSTSGLNAASSLATLTEHLEAAISSP
jgi:TDG/mug DNA glycosylase family protein